MSFHETTRNALLLAAIAAGAAMALLIGGVDADRIVDRPTSGSGVVATAPGDAGIRFSCRGDSRRMASVRRALPIYLAEQGIPFSWVTERKRKESLTYTLNTPAGDSSTLDFFKREAMGLSDAVVHLPTAVAGKLRAVHTVSKKEIVLALLQHGRLTEFDCDVAAVQDRVGMLQNIVAWTETLDWIWPDGGSAAWNEKYWKRGTPLPGYPLHEAVNNAFMEPERYAIGCYTATKLVILQGILDYYRRIRPDAEKLRRIEAWLAADGEPLSDIEPDAMWFFEDDYRASDRPRPGKVVALHYGVAADNFIPGDWAYLLNTDAVSYQKTGYEGSNMIYLGRGRFDDYYNDNHHFYTFRQKLSEVYQWRHGVFSRVRDAAKIKPLSEREYQALTGTPETGGLLQSYRGVIAVDAIFRSAAPGDRK
ncbi:MAG: hypothetical protein M0P39_07225 [Rhodocyclaceae bacterium]|nr:hypothetical protein [Rhodocyclaceae bacterium]